MRRRKKIERTNVAQFKLAILQCATTILKHFELKFLKTALAEFTQF